MRTSGRLFNRYLLQVYAGAQHDSTSLTTSAVPIQRLLIYHPTLRFLVASLLQNDRGKIPLFQRGKAAFYFLTAAVCLTMLRKSAALRLAPPTRAPSISDWLINSVVLAALTLPP
jgi:hypothetical protein